MKGLTDPMVGLLMGQTAENLAFRFGITRREMDEFAARSHQRVLAAQKAGHYAGEVVPLYDKAGKLYAADDGVREDSTAENLAKLKPFFDRKYGNVTAGNSSQVTDGAAWLVLASERAVDKHKLAPLGRIVDSQWAGLDPAQMGLGPVHAATPILQRHGLGLDDLDAWEINEAFAAQVIACERAWDERRVLPQRARPRRARWAARRRASSTSTAAPSRSATRSARRARASCCTCSTCCARTGGKRGMAAICIGGGLGGAMLVERVTASPPAAGCRAAPTTTESEARCNTGRSPARPTASPG